MLKYDSASSEWIDDFVVNTVYASTTQTLAAKHGINRIEFGGPSDTTSITLTVTTPGTKSVLHVINNRQAACDLVVGSSTWTILPNQGGTWVSNGVNSAKKIGSSSNDVVTQYFNSNGTFAINTKDLHVLRIGGNSINVALDINSGNYSGLLLIENYGTGNTISGPTFRLNGQGSSGGTTTLSLNDGERRLFYINNNGLLYEANATSLDRLSDVSISSPIAGQALVYNGTVFENASISTNTAASESVAGVIEIATSAEATTGTDDTRAMTPLKVKTAIDAAVVGGVEYKGTFDALSLIHI